MYVEILSRDFLCLHAKYILFALKLQFALPAYRRLKLLSYLKMIKCQQMISTVDIGTASEDGSFYYRTLFTEFVRVSSCVPSSH